MIYRSPLHLIALFASVALISCPLAASAYANDYPADGRIKILRYDPDDIFTIYTLYGYQTNIEFSRGEQVQTISVGDRSLWQIIPSANRLFIRPMDDEVSTNMTVITNTRTYNFDLKSGKGELADNPRMIYVARFEYPDKKKDAMYAPSSGVSPITPVIASSTQQPGASAPLLTPPPAAPLTSIQPPLPSAAPLPPEAASASASSESKAAGVSAAGTRINEKYTYTGADELAPVLAYDDGQATYLKFAPSMNQFPTIRTLAADGQSTPVKYTIRDGVIVLNAIAPTIMLSYEDGNQTVYVYNETLNPEGTAHGQ